MAEGVVLDPSEVAISRTEVDLSAAGGAIRVAEGGVDWGDAAIEAFMAARGYGDLPVDFRVPNRQVVIPLIIQGKGATTFAVARSQVAAKAGLFQREGGWLKRTIGATKLYLDVVSAALHLSGDGLAALGLVDGNAALTLECIPDFYGDEGQVGADHVETTATELYFTDTAPAGEWPARVRIVVDNDQAVDQRGLSCAISCRNFSAAATAAPRYEAEALTPMGATAIATRTGGSGGASNNVLRNTDLGTSWGPVMNTNLLAGTYLTHEGTYRIRARVYSPDGANVKLRAVWDVGDSIDPSENDAWTFPGANNFYIADLGIIRLDKPPVGPHRWQAQIQAKGAVGGEDVDIDKLWLENLDDASVLLAAPPVSLSSSSPPSARDEFNQTAGVLAGKALPLGGTWSGAGDADDLSVDATNHVATRVAVSDAANVPRYEIIGATNYSDTHIYGTAMNSVGTSSSGGSADPSRIGFFARYIDANNWVAATVRFVAPSRIALDIYKRVAGVLTKIGSDASQPYTAGQPFIVDFYVYATGNWAAYVNYQGVISRDASGYDADLATGGALASGKPGIFDYWNEATAATRTYDNIVVQAITPDAVAFASRSVQLTTDGNYRQDPTGIAYGPVASQDGLLLRLPPGGLEARTFGCMIKMSRGDFDSLPDSGIDDLSAKVFARPAYLFAPATA